jgi:hypothetical protein
MLGSVPGRPMALKLLIQKVTVRWLLAWRPTSLAAHRARLLTLVATLACMLVNEVARLQVCDLWFDYLASCWVPCFEGTCSVHIDRRKNGHYPFGVERALPRTRPLEGPRARHCSAAADLVAGSRAGSSWGLRQADPARGALRSMPSVVPVYEVRAGCITVVTGRPCSRQQASDWIRWAVAQAGRDSTRFSDKGCISAAIEAGVDEAILYLQSGHGQALPARAYMHLTSPDRFFETFEAFSL